MKKKYRRNLHPFYECKKGIHNIFHIKVRQQILSMCLLSFPVIMKLRRPEDPPCTKIATANYMRTHIHIYLKLSASIAFKFD